MEDLFLNGNKIVPVVVIERLEDTIPMLEQLQNGGISIAEITFRTHCAAKAIIKANKHFGNMVIGAGTVINGEQCEMAIDAGAKFIVSPGFSMSVALTAQKYQIPYLPGVATPTDIVSAVNNGFKLLKFFPASGMGGVKMLKSLAAAFPNVKFLPTGGIDENNILEYLSLPYVVAVGGSFMFSDGLQSIKEKTQNALKIVEGV